MSEADTVPTEERLPWLGEDAEPVRDHRTRDAIGLAIVAALLIFGVSYWIASQSWQRAREHAENQAVAPPAAVPLPKAPHAVAPRHHRQAATASSTAPRVAQRPVAHPKQQLAAKAPTTSEVAKAVSETKIAATKPAPATPAKEVATAAVSPSKAVTGRIVRVGAFASPVEARLGWHSMVRAYPVLAHLPAAVVDASTAHSRPSYRFEIGTTSEANSAMLCQRMARINFACAVAAR